MKPLPYRDSIFPQCLSAKPASRRNLLLEAGIDRGFVSGRSLSDTRKSAHASAKLAVTKSAGCDCARPRRRRRWAGGAAGKVLLLLGLIWLVGAASLPAQVGTVFGVYRELWPNLNGNVGNTLDALTNTANNPNWPDSPDPDYTKVFTNFETEVNSGMDLYGQRLRTFVVPPVNGDYVFWIASDDTSELFVSTDEDPANKSPVAWVLTWTDSREWTKEPNQQSAPLYLEAGCRYYMEAIMQQGYGGDNLAVRWQLPNGVIEEPMTAVSPAGTFLIECDGVELAPGIYEQTTNVTLVEGLNARLSVLVTNPAPVTYQWRLHGTNLPGSSAQHASLTISNVTVAVNNGQTYTCVVSNFIRAVPSAPVTLTVQPDTVRPAVATVFNVGTTNVQLLYTKPVELASATNRANYVFTDGLAVKAGSLDVNNTTVTLLTAPLVYGSNYSLVINHVRDRATVPNTIATNTTVSFTALPYAVLAIGNPSTPTVLTAAGDGMNLTASGTDVGGLADQFGFGYQLWTGNFDLAVRLAGLGLSDTWAKAGLMARETLDAAGRFAAALATPAMVGCLFEWRDPAGSASNSSGNFPANYPNAWLRLQRVGNTFNGFASYDGQTWTLLGTATITMPAQIYLGLAVSAHNSKLPTLAQFRDLAAVTNAVVAGSQFNPHEPLGPCSRRTPLVISEIMYQPAPRNDARNLAFIELYNSNPWFQDISGYQLSGVNMAYTFPPGTVLAGGAFLVVAASPPDLQSAYGITNVAGPYTGSLRESDTLQLLDGLGAILLTIPYASLSPWPVAAGGAGHSLVLANPTYGEADPRAWDISDVVGGSPGQLEAYRPSPLRNVLINEFLVRSTPPDYNYVELYNHANTPVDISGCILTDDPTTNKFVLPAGTIIPARGFVSFSETTMNFAPSAVGATIYFKNPDSSRVLDAVSFGGQENGVATGRWPDGADQFYRLSSKTPGAPNAAIRLSDVVINELMYDPISGNDDDQYVELYNRSANSVNLGAWALSDAISYTFPANTLLAPDGYLVVARNAARLCANYTNLNAANCLGNFGGRLAHNGEHLALTKPDTIVTTNSEGLVTATLIRIMVNDVTYGTGGRWGQWARGGGSSLELCDPNSNNHLAYNWADSDETMKSAWTNLEFTGVLDNGANYGSAIDYVQVGLLDVGECLVDNIEVRPGGPSGPNIATNSDFEAGLAGWVPQGDHIRSSLETAGGLGGYQSAQSLHLRASDGMWTLSDYVQGALTQTTLVEGQTATLRLKARWLRGWPEVLLRLRGNWLDVTGRMPVPVNLGTPGRRNSRYVANGGPAIYEVKHSPALPPANQPLVVTARLHSPRAVQATLLYRIDTAVNPAPSYTSVPMTDNGTGGDAVAGDGIFSATIPAQPAGTVVAFLVQAQDALGATTVFPADLRDNAGVPRECVAAFGDATPAGSFRHQHVFITQNWANRWAQGGGVSHETHDGTWVDSGGRIIYDWTGRYAGSPYHQYTGSPVTMVGGMHWIVPRDDLLYGVESLNKQHVPGNGALDDDTLQREQASFWMAQQIGLPGENRRYYVYYVNGVRHGPLMEDAQTPDADMLKEFFPNDNSGYLFKNHAWFEGDVFQQSDGYMNFNNMSWCVLGGFTTTINGVRDQYKPARYRWMWWLRQYPSSANDFSALFDLIDAANTPQADPAFYAKMEALVDTEEWMRLSAIEHATGDWDSFFTQNQWNMYTYKPALGKWTALKWDWNITLGGGTSTWGPDGGNLFNVGSNDPVMGALQNFPAYRRAYLRALQDIANLAMNNALVDPLLDAKYAAFVANGLTVPNASGFIVRDPGASLKSWIATMHNSLLAAPVSQGVAGVSFAVTSVSVANNVATVSGTAPVSVKAVWFNGVPWPLTWPSVTTWQVSVPLQPGTNSFNVVGVDPSGQAVPGAVTSVTAVYPGALPSPVGEVVINEIMYSPPLPNAQYLELYNRANVALDLSGWQLRGLDYTFSPGAFIAPNSYLMLAADLHAYWAAYGASNLAFDTFAGPFPADGLLSLVRPGFDPASDLTVAQVRYGSAPPWPVAANGLGASLQLIDPSQDIWRAGNWAGVPANTFPVPRWVQVRAAIRATSSTLCLYLGSAGDIYLDDVQLLDANNHNLVTDGDFESPLSGFWTLAPNFALSSLSTDVKHSGNSSLHLVATAPGTGIGNAVYQTISPPLSVGQYYTLSFFYLQSTNGGPLAVGLTSASAISVNPAPAVSIIAPATPGAANSVLDNLAPFPPLWLNELQADNLTGATNRAGQHVPWLELYNPTTNVVSLAGLYLANTYTNLTQWAFPDGAVINPSSFMVVFADAQTNLSTLGELHAGFALASGAGSLALSRLYNGQPQVLDFIDYSNLAINCSYGSLPDGQSFFRQEFAHPTPGGANNASAGGSLSFIAYAVPGAVYNQDFNSLPNPGPTSVNSANPVTINGITYSLANPFDFAAPPAASGATGGLGLPALAGWFGLADPTASGGARFGASDGDMTTGGQISFGLPNSPNRALGLLATATTGFTAFGARFINATPDILDHINLQFTGEVWRQSDKAKTLTFYYWIDLTGTNYFSVNNTAFLPSLNVSLPAVPADAGGVAVDGTAPADQVTLSVTNQPIAGWPPGAALWLVWEMSDPAGKAQGLAIDDLSFSASGLPALTAVPLTVQLAPGGNFVMSWPTFTGQFYQVEYKNNLADPSWMPLGAPVAGAGVPLTVTNALTTSAQRFFRLSVQR